MTSLFGCWMISRGNGIPTTRGTPGIMQWTVGSSIFFIFADFSAAHGCIGG
jgi:hypothetical protein